MPWDGTADALAALIPGTLPADPLLQAIGCVLRGESSQSACQLPLRLELSAIGATRAYKLIGARGRSEATSGHGLGRRQGWAVGATAAVGATRVGALAKAQRRRSQGRL